MNNDPEKKTVKLAALEDKSETTTCICPPDGAKLGKYEDLERVGEGGMATVFRAHDTKLKRKVALKILKRDVNQTSEEQERFQREIHIQAGLDIPGCVKVFDCGNDDGWLYFAMEFVEGQTLCEVFRKDLTLKRKIAIIARVAEILAKLHDKGLTHRDIKPNNIMLDSHDEIKLLDFGLMKPMEADSLIYHTQTGYISGTPAYIPPEKTSRNTDVPNAPSGDVYALGIMAYEAFSGKFPFQVEGLTVHETLEVLRTEEPEPLSKAAPRLNKRIASVVMAALDKNPNNRPTAGGFAAELKEAMNAGERRSWYRVMAIAAAVIIAFIICFEAIRIGMSGGGSEEKGVKPQPPVPVASPVKNPEKKLIGIEFVEISPGKFQMGSEKGNSDEKPVRTVKISNKFWISKKEITEAEYNAVMSGDMKALTEEKKKETGNKPLLSFSGSDDSSKESDKKIDTGDKPVRDISWTDAERFCRKLNKYVKSSIPAGYVFRLPTEAEWEYCCRAGTKTDYSCGSMIDELGEFANFGSKDDVPEKAGSRQPNAWGIHDMHGNVWEWCNDSKSNYADSASTDPVGKASAYTRIARGGAWDSPAGSCRSANRIEHNKSYKNRNLGFRIVLAKPCD